MSSHDNRDNVERVASATKRISTLNGHEGHILRRRINAYQKIHNREIAGVSNKLEEIRESMKALAFDPLYGTHALDEETHASVNAPSSVKPRSGVVSADHRFRTLRRTQSFPDLLDEQKDSSSSSFPELTGGDTKKARRAEKTALNGRTKPRVQSVGAANKRRQQTPDGAFFGTEARDGTVGGHKKLERSKTAPVTMLQPLLKTTPEMMRKKIQIATSIRHSSAKEDYTRKSFSPAQIEEASSKLNPPRRSADQNILHQPKTIPDGRGMMDYKLATRSLEEPGKHRFIGHDFAAHGSAEDSDSIEISGSFRTAVKTHGRRVETFQKSDFTEERNHASDSQNLADLKNCRYLRFTAESQENNRI